LVIIRARIAFNIFKGFYCGNQYVVGRKGPVYVLLGSE
jgi:hypothetical protein